MNPPIVNPYDRSDRPQLAYIQEPPKAVVSNEKVVVRDKDVQFGGTRGSPRVGPKLLRIHCVHRSPWKEYKYIGKLLQSSGNYRFFSLGKTRVMIKKKRELDAEQTILPTLRHTNITNIYTIFKPENGYVYISLDPCEYTLEEFLVMKGILSKEEVHLIAKAVSFDLPVSTNKN